MQSFNHLVVVVDGEPLASSLTVANGMKAKHKNVLELIRRHSDVLAEFGGVAFETQSFGTKGGAQSREVAMLNEQQAALLISLMRNTEEVVSFKARLIREFYRMRDALRQRDMNLWQQLQAAIANEVDSAVRASFGSHLMLDRKKAKPVLQSEIRRLEAEIQPGLLLN